MPSLKINQSASPYVYLKYGILKDFKDPTGNLNQINDNKILWKTII